MSRKNKNFRAWEYQNPGEQSTKAAWDAAWKSKQDAAHSQTIQHLEWQKWRLEEQLKCLKSENRALLACFATPLEDIES